MKKKLENEMICLIYIILGFYMFFTFRFTFILFSALAISACNDSETFPQVQSSVYDNSLGPLCWPTQFTKEHDSLIITDYKNNRILVNRNGKWERTNLTINGAHSLVTDKKGNFIIDDTENNRIIISTSLSDSSVIKYITSVNGKPLNRPHSVVASNDGYIYAIDALRLIKISKDYKKTAELWFKPGDLGYARSLKMIDGYLYVINSSKGDLIKINDFDKNSYEIIKTISHKIDDAAGSYERTGPILNDIDKFKGWYYASNYFTSSWSKKTDAESHKLIRWKTWHDFKKGNFQDVSYLLPKGQLPYFIHNTGDSLLLTTFNHENPCSGENGIVVK
ncbi:TPA: hypothetical protein ACWLDC_000069 [Escherichia coli]